MQKEHMSKVNLPCKGSWFTENWKIYIVRKGWWHRQAP
jgi:hypothetical protein